MGKTAVIIGATGLVGSFLVRELLGDSAYSTVMAFARTPLGIKHPKLIENPFPSHDAFPATIKGEDFFCCLGTTIKKAKSREAFRAIDFELPLSFAKAAREGGVSHFLLVSSVGANSDSPIFYARVKGDLETAIEQIGFPAYTIVRPGLLLGPRKEFRLGEKIGSAIQEMINPFLLGKLGDYRSVSAQDVAHCLVDAARCPPQGRHIISSREIPRRTAVDHG